MDNQMVWLTAGWVVAAVFFVVALFFFGALFRAAGDVVKIRKEKAGLQAEVVKHRRWLADAEAIRSDLRKDLANARALLDAVEKEKNTRIAELEASLAGMDKLCEANRKDWVDARNRCGVLEVELAGQKDIASGLVSQIAKQAQEEKALREALARQEVDWVAARDRVVVLRGELAQMKESLREEFDRASLAESALKAARDEGAEVKRLVERLHQAIAERDQAVLALKDECQTYARLMTDLKGKLDFASGGMAQARDAIGVAMEAYNRPILSEADETA